jgi:hypothetical protein
LHILKKIIRCSLTASLYKQAFEKSGLSIDDGSVWDVVRNEVNITDNLTGDDMLNYAHTVADKVGENNRMMHQIRNNPPEQAFLGDFPQVVNDAVMDSSNAHQNQMMQVLSKH